MTRATRTPRVLLDATGVSRETTGLGQYSTCLTAALVERARFDYSVLHQQGLASDHPLLRMRAAGARLIPLRTPVLGPARELAFAGRAARFDRHDLYHCLSSYLPAFGIRAPAVLTVHDLKYVREPALLRSRVKAAYLRWIIARGVRNARAVIAVSTATRDDLRGLYSSSARVRVIHEGPTLGDPSDALPEAIAGRSFFLAVGVNRPHKNYPRLIAAYANAQRRLGQRAPALAIAGTGVENLAALTGDLGSHVVLLGHVDDATLAGLYRGALALVYPSLYEGFGLPLLEAMSTGTPVIASAVSSLPEVAGDAALLVNPHNVDDIADAMVRMASDNGLRADLARRGVARAARYSWRQAAEQTEQVYQEVLA